MTDSSSSSISIDSINSMIGATNTSRVSGLASGIDVDSIVAKLMTAESQPLVQMQQKLQQTEWQRDDYRSMNTLLSNMQATIQKMKLQGPYLAKTATSSDSSKVTATGGANSGNVAYTLSNVTMATAAHNQSDSSIVTDKTKFDSSAYLSTQSEFIGELNNPITFTIKTYNDGTAKSKEFSFDPSTTSLDTIMANITSSDVGVNAFYDSATGQVSMTRTATGDNHTGTRTKDGSGNVTAYTGAEIEFSGDFLTST
ncbi:MAG: hypothetical protein K0Q53_2088, partial [Massilibacillus sp.]|nr:hypothetical protein [Massilibacillus sp.]